MVVSTYRKGGSECRKCGSQSPDSRLKRSRNIQPVPIITPETEAVFEQLLNKLLDASKKNISTIDVERAIDIEIYNMLNLEDAEIDFIESFRNI